ncbi:MAG TPA: hypothetical protein VGE22_06630 [Solimonas sp.]
MDISAALALGGQIKTAMEFARVLRGTVPTLEKAEINLQLAELISRLADAQVGEATVRQEILAMQERIAQLERELRGDVFFRTPFYWRKEERGEDGPFCPACHDSKGGAMIRLYQYSAGMWDCKVCSARYIPTPAMGAVGQSRAIMHNPYED